MRRILAVLLSAFVVCGLICGCSTSDAATRDICPDKNSEIQYDVSPRTIDVNLIDTPAYDNDVNYMDLMVMYANIGDIEALEDANNARNAKIAGEQLGYEQITVEEFLSNYDEYAGFSSDIDYMSIMQQCCLSGDVNAGRDAENSRNAKINTLGLINKKISFDELLELSKIITAEAGSDWLSMEWKMMVGEVVLNRVSSTEFPNTVYDVIHQYGQYSNANTEYYRLLVPFESCVHAATRLLSGERLLNDNSVVFQSGVPQGSGTHTKLYDSYYGYTYLCYSGNPELYE